MDTYMTMQLNLPDGHQGLNAEQIRQLQEVYDLLSESKNQEYDALREGSIKHYDAIIDRRIRQYDNVKIILAGLYTLLDNTSQFDRDYKPIIRTIKSRTMELEELRDDLYKEYLYTFDETENRLKLIQELFEKTDLYVLYSNPNII